MRADQEEVVVTGAPAGTGRAVAREFGGLTSQQSAEPRDPSQPDNAAGLAMKMR
jgi:NAD(P)-dependent dehydrogenase (short-subunit alcohol dehydrogenase family)